jgi:hypothetical protein
MTSGLNTAPSVPLLSSRFRMQLLVSLVLTSLYLAKGDTSMNVWINCTACRAINNSSHTVAEERQYTSMSSCERWVLALVGTQTLPMEFGHRDPSHHDKCGFC